MTSQQRDAYRSAARAAGLTVPEHANVVPLADGGAIVECEVEISAKAMRQHLPDPPMGMKELSDIIRDSTEKARRMASTESEHRRTMEVPKG
ncbi:MAG: hypothetical protein AB7Q45_17625 [Planctomycetaceae bacterium]